MGSVPLGSARETPSLAAAVLWVILTPQHHELFGPKAGWMRLGVLHRPDIRT
jgi:hypothetical protein